MFRKSSRFKANRRVDSSGSRPTFLRCKACLVGSKEEGGLSLGSKEEGGLSLGSKEEGGLYRW